jgi:hypothetical protein
MLEALAATAAHPDQAAALGLFGRFVGSWDVEGTLIAPDGARSAHRGEWHFGWVLEGRAIQDVLISPPRSEGGPAFEYGTTLRFYDAARGAWRVTWCSPVTGAVVTLLARASGEDIVLDGRLGDGRLVRWSFSEITRDAFLWQGRVSGDEGATWRLEEEMRVRRR